MRLRRGHRNPTRSTWERSGYTSCHGLSAREGCLAGKRIDASQYTSRGQNISGSRHRGNCLTEESHCTREGAVAVGFEGEMEQTPTAIHSQDQTILAHKIVGLGCSLGMRTTTSRKSGQSNGLWREERQKNLLLCWLGLSIIGVFLREFGVVPSNCRLPLTNTSMRLAGPESYELTVTILCLDQCNIILEDLLNKLPHTFSCNIETKHRFLDDWA